MGEVEPSASPIITLPASPVGWDSGHLQFGPKPRGMAGDSAG